MTNLIPLGDNVLVEAIEEEKTTTSGLILPDNNQEKPSRGKVVAIGKGKIKEDGERAPMDVTIGDIVHFTKYAPDELEVGNGDSKKNYLIVSQSSILAIEK